MSAKAVKLENYSRPSFDYDAVDATTADFARGAVERIRANERAAAVDIGRDLIAVKEKLGHGHFGKWLLAEFGWTPRTAQNAMQVAALFGDKYETISHLPRALQYAIAAPSAPQAVRDAVRRYDSAYPINPRDLQRQLADAKKKTRDAAAKARMTDPKEVAAREKEESERARTIAKARHQDEVRSDRARTAAESVGAMLGARLSEFKGLVGGVDANEFMRFIREL